MLLRKFTCHSFSLLILPMKVSCRSLNTRLHLKNYLKGSSWLFPDELETGSNKTNSNLQQTWSKSALVVSLWLEDEALRCLQSSNCHQKSMELCLVTPLKIFLCFPKIKINWKYTFPLYLEHSDAPFPLMVTCFLLHQPSGIQNPCCSWDTILKRIRSSYTVITQLAFGSNHCIHFN